MKSKLSLFVRGFLCGVPVVLLFLFWPAGQPAADRAGFSVPAAFAARGSRAPRTESEEQAIEVYRRSSRGVVNISTRTEAVDFFGSVQQEGSGSGVIIDAKHAYVLTNVHVISSASQVAITLSNGQAYGARIVGADPDNDIALLQIVEPPEELVEVEMGESSDLEVGQRVLAIGSPFGLSSTMTSGIVSSVGRSIRANTGRLIEDVIQTDAAINPGNSGGPLLDSAGRIIGINTAIVSGVGESSGIGFAVPINRVKSSLSQLIRFGKVLRPRFGFVLGDTRYGPALFDVEQDGPADRAGLSPARRQVREGFFIGVVTDLSKADFITAVQGKEVASKTEVLDELYKVKPGDEVELAIRRGVNPKQVRAVTIKPDFR